MGITVCIKEIEDKAFILNCLHVLSFINMFSSYLGLNNFKSDLSSLLTDEIIYKLIAAKSKFEDNDLLTYLLDRNILETSTVYTAFDFFKHEEWA